MYITSTAKRVSIWKPPKKHVALVFRCLQVWGICQTFFKSTLVGLMFWKFACSNVKAGSALVASTATSQHGHDHGRFGLCYCKWLLKECLNRWWINSDATKADLLPTSCRSRIIELTGAVLASKWRRRPSPKKKTTIAQCDFCFKSLATVYHWR